MLMIMFMLMLRIIVMLTITIMIAITITISIMTDNDNDNDNDNDTIDDKVDNLKQHYRLLFCLPLRHCKLFKSSPQSRVFAIAVQSLCQ